MENKFVKTIYLLVIVSYLLLTIVLVIISCLKKDTDAAVLIGISSAAACVFLMTEIRKPKKKTDKTNENKIKNSKK